MPAPTTASVARVEESTRGKPDADPPREFDFPFLCLIRIQNMHKKPKYNGVHGRVIQERKCLDDPIPRFDVILRGALDGWCLTYVHPNNMVKISDADPREIRSAMNGPGFDIPRC